MKHSIKIRISKTIIYILRSLYLYIYIFTSKLLNGVKIDGIIEIFVPVLVDIFLNDYLWFSSFTFVTSNYFIALLFV